MTDPKETIQRTISKYLDLDGCFVFLFGSRSGKKYRNTSDYDIGLYSGQKISLSTMAQIKADLEESRIPVKVDVVDFFCVSDKFKKLALKEIEIWNRPKNDLKLM